MQVPIKRRKQNLLARLGIRDNKYYNLCTKQFDINNLREALAETENGDFLFRFVSTNGISEVVTMNEKNREQALQQILDLDPSRFTEIHRFKNQATKEKGFYGRVVFPMGERFPQIAPSIIELVRDSTARPLENINAYDGTYLWFERPSYAKPYRLREFRLADDETEESEVRASADKVLKRITDWQRDLSRLATLMQGVGANSIGFEFTYGQWGKDATDDIFFYDYDTGMDVRALNIIEEILDSRLEV
ncbi:MAG: hypothetical protein FWE31_03720 [Firmicutes bacterium]|nr:hypothetical protein [Bacillota bacterium]